MGYTRGDETSSHQTGIASAQQHRLVAGLGNSSNSSIGPPGMVSLPVCGPVVKSPPANGGVTGGAGSMPRSGRFPGEGNGTPLHYSCLGNPMDSSCGAEELDTTEHGTHRHGLTGSWKLQVWTTFESAL